MGCGKKRLVRKLVCRLLSHTCNIYSIILPKRWSSLDRFASRMGNSREWWYQIHKSSKKPGRSWGCVGRTFKSLEPQNMFQLVSWECRLCLKRSLATDQSLRSVPWCHDWGIPIPYPPVHIFHPQTKPWFSMV